MAIAVAVVNDVFTVAIVVVVDDCIVVEVDIAFDVVVVIDDDAVVDNVDVVNDVVVRVGKDDLPRLLQYPDLVEVVK